MQNQAICRQRVEKKMLEKRSNIPRQTQTLPENALPPADPPTQPQADVLVAPKAQHYPAHDSAFQQESCGCLVDERTRERQQQRHCHLFGDAEPGPPDARPHFLRSAEPERTVSLLNTCYCHIVLTFLQVCPTWTQ
jgi:hypothetical protein